MDVNAVVSGSASKCDGRRSGPTDRGIAGRVDGVRRLL